MPLDPLQYLHDIKSMVLHARAQLVEKSLPDDPVLFRKGLLVSEIITYVAQCNNPPLDLQTLTLHQPNAHPQLVALFQAADNARCGCQLLRGDNVPRNDPQHEESFKLAQRLFVETALQHMDAAFTGSGIACVDTFKKLALAAFVKLDTRIERNWAALVREDVRWCLACFEGGRAALQEQLPQTAVVFQTLQTYQQMYPAPIALDLAWDALASGSMVQEGTLALPVLDCE